MRHSLGAKIAKSNSDIELTKHWRRPRAYASLKFAHAGKSGSYSDSGVRAPRIGYFHGTYRDKHSLVFDLMEPLRAEVDRDVLEFVRRHVFEPDDFTLTREGVCRLNPQLARRIVGTVCTTADLQKMFSGTSPNA